MTFRKKKGKQKYYQEQFLFKKYGKIWSSLQPLQYLHLNSYNALQAARELEQQAL